MTDLERTKELLNSMNIEFAEDINKDKSISITVDEDQDKVDWAGYFGFAFWFRFYEDGKLMNVGATGL